MARVTVEDCIQIIPNRFDLVSVAAQRARQIMSGSPLTIERDNDKDTVVSLREIAEGTVSPETLRNEVILSHQKYGKADVIDESAPMIGAPKDAEIAEQMQALEAESKETFSEDELDGLSFGDEEIDDAKD